MQSAHRPTPEPGAPAAELPAGHPPITASPSAADILPPVDVGTGTGSAALVWTAPEGWVAETPSNSMRRAQWRIPGDAGDGECVVFYFGPGQGGEPMENAERWASQFTGANGQPALGSMRTRSEQVGEISVLFVEANGTYQSGSMMGMGGGVAKPDWALLGAIAEGPDANWFFKLTGPRATVEAQHTAFETMLRSLQRGG